MRVSQRLDYALRALTLLAQHPVGTAIAVADVAERLHLPKRFLEQQMTLLAARGIVRCRRGVGGGCSLARPANSISVAEVVEALEGDVMDVPAVSGSAVSELWSALAGTMRDMLSDVQLADLAERQCAADERPASMYFI